jgi:hypothetical protein
MTRSNCSEYFILLFYYGSLFSSSIGVCGCFIIIFDGILIINIKCIV